MSTALTPGTALTTLSDVKPRHRRGLARLGLLTVRDLLLHIPVGWDSYGEPSLIADLMDAQRATVIGTVTSIAAQRTIRRQMTLAKARVVDRQGSTLEVVWFNQPWLVTRVKRGDRVALAGEVRPDRFGRGLEMRNPHYEVITSENLQHLRVGGLMPRYQLSAGLNSRFLAGLVEKVLPLAEELEDSLPDLVRRRHRLLTLPEAVRQGHRPADENEWRAARQRMAWAELFELQAAFILARRRQALERAEPVPYRQDVIDAFKAGLGFELTRAQRRATWEVFQDMAQKLPMNRLLNGDVGSGKTVVAAAGAAMAHAAGRQTVVMAPTEILARQHLQKFRAYLEDSFPELRVELLVSGLPAAERRRVLTAVASGHAAVLVGTHALLETGVDFAELGLAVVDEQHRFGTRQRENLRKKGLPHFMAMTATPIPRTLALALYGEMALSVIDEMPPGRTQVATEVISPGARERAYELVRREVGAGRQAFIICPLVEESEAIQVRAATVEFERLRSEVFPDLRLSLVHGRMRDKDAVMRGFRDHESDVLVATPVIEVGVDIPNATVMVIEGADRFGLAQLHQFRGRVGRGPHPGYTLLLADDPAEASLERLELVARVRDGFRLAEEDMRRRGVGELMGSRQHGMSDLAMQALQQPELLSEVRQEAELVVGADPELEENPGLRGSIERRLDDTSIS